MIFAPLSLRRSTRYARRSRVEDAARERALNLMDGHVAGVPASLLRTDDSGTSTAVDAAGPQGGAHQRDQGAGGGEPAGAGPRPDAGGGWGREADFDVARVPPRPDATGVRAAREPGHAVNFAHDR